MTINKLPNQDDVLHRSGVAGIDVNFVRKIPDEIGVSSSGNAKYNSKDYGLWVGDSGTSGDTAGMTTLSTASVNDFSKIISLFDLWVLESPVTDDIEIGSIDDSGVNTDAGAYYDLTADQYHLAGATAAATNPGSYTNTRLIIEKDQTNNETTFTQVGPVNESVTFSDVDDGNGNIVAYNSNGNSDRAPAVTRFNRVFIP
jgi:hypothetical protein